ncbi:MAG: penicillin acylase family protein, partial [Candidatus Bathyarchaeia archaeon]
WIPRATSPAPLPSPWNNTYPDPISLPYCENPAQGFIATANNQPIDPSYPGYPWPVWISPACGFAPGYRGERITELIQSLAPLDIDDMIAIQGDSLSIPARIFVPIINETMAGDTNTTIQDALAILNAWNFTALRDLVAPLIFEVWYDYYEENTFFDNFEPFNLSRFPNMIIPLRYMTENPEDPYSVVLFDDQNTPLVNETMADIINASLHDAVEWIASQLGTNMSNWQYGKLHVVNFNHPMGEFLSELNVPETPVGCDGSAYTVDPGGHYHKLIVEKTYLFVESGASYRGIYECKDDWDTSLILVPPGESGLITGNPMAMNFDPHCNDTFLMWLNNQYTPCLFIIMRGDINYDGTVDIFDLVTIGIRYGSEKGKPPPPGTQPYEEFADINGDGVIDIFDVVKIGIEYGETWGN